MGRAGKNLHRNMLAGKGRNTLSSPTTNKNAGLPMNGTPTPINPASKPSIPTGRKYIKKY